MYADILKRAYLCQVSDTGSPEPLVKYVLSDGISQAFLPFRFVDVTVITDHDLFWNVGQANGILKYFENMMIDHSDSTIFG
jgi:hypothetical protein